MTKRVLLFQTCPVFSGNILFRPPAGSLRPVRQLAKSGAALSVTRCRKIRVSEHEMSGNHFLNCSKGGGKCRIQAAHMVRPIAGTHSAGGVQRGWPARGSAADKSGNLGGRRRKNQRGFENGKDHGRAGKKNTRQKSGVAQTVQKQQLAIRMCVRLKGGTGVFVRLVRVGVPQHPAIGQNMAVNVGQVVTQ